MKSYTDIEQSKKLAEILPIESADMCYPKDAFEYNYAKEPVCHYSGIGLAHPCWSLTALLNVLDYPQLSKDKLGGGKTGWMVSVYPDNCRHDSCWHDNPVDACVGMIIKLKEINSL